MRVKHLLLAVVLVSVTLSGCTPVKGYKKSGSLSSGDLVSAASKYVDIYSVIGNKNGTANITLDGTGFDEVIYVVYSDGSLLCKKDSSYSLPEICTFNITKGQHYFVLFTSYSIYETGSYNADFSEECKDGGQLSYWPYGLKSLDSILTDPDLRNDKTK